MYGTCTASDRGKQNGLHPIDGCNKQAGDLFCAFLRGLSSAPGELTENRTGTVFEMLKKGFGPTAPSAVIAG
ncbi:hypothetical protein B7R78_0020700 [Ralstonia solanacearum]|uniref:hypothetical protein n=1 Tax=Ralstonia solanacearum species complex TaxID=3116862 RepID=UPI00113FF3ED|nr:hypothetical protein [Ralstonia solanacearum]MBT1539408.1 hypothetical protein [Ralstonia solanacearum]QOK84379.1 hypothetical protein HF906_20025 [Ralstonia solanacearum]